ncbi:MAG: rane protein [Clostridia bacterium]|jgi:putative flippase GtrA|nr:rane protein [Clostridia bacterium]
MLKRIFNLNIAKYFLISCLASVLDLGISNYLYNTTRINYLIACNLGIALGFLFQYFTGMKYVFKGGNRPKTFLIYIGTFALGLLLANTTIWTSYNILQLSFFYSKMMSMLVPFFITYFIRKTLLGANKGGESKYENALQI